MSAEAKEPLDLQQAFKRAKILHTTGSEGILEFLDLFEKICLVLDAPLVSINPLLIPEDERVRNVRYAKRLAIYAVIRGQPVDPDSVPKEFLKRLNPFMMTNQK